jgi:hypothetical protein
VGVPAVPIPLIVGLDHYYFEKLPKIFPKGHSGSLVRSCELVYAGPKREKGISKYHVVVDAAIISIVCWYPKRVTSNKSRMRKLAL